MPTLKYGIFIEESLNYEKHFIPAHFTHIC